MSAPASGVRPEVRAYVDQRISGVQSSMGGRFGRMRGYFTDQLRYLTEGLSTRVISASESLADKLDEASVNLQGECYEDPDMELDMVMVHSDNARLLEFLRENEPGLFSKVTRFGRVLHTDVEEADRVDACREFFDPIAKFGTPPAYSYLGLGRAAGGGAGAARMGAAFDVLKYNAYLYPECLDAYLEREIRRHGGNK